MVLVIHTSDIKSPHIYAHTNTHRVTDSLCLLLHLGNEQKHLHLISKSWSWADRFSEASPDAYWQIHQEMQKRERKKDVPALERFCQHFRKWGCQLSQLMFRLFNANILWKEVRKLQNAGSPQSCYYFWYPHEWLTQKERAKQNRRNLSVGPEPVEWEIEPNRNQSFLAQPFSTQWPLE